MLHYNARRSAGLRQRTLLVRAAWHGGWECSGEAVDLSFALRLHKICCPKSTVPLLPRYVFPSFLTLPCPTFLPLRLAQQTHCWNPADCKCAGGTPGQRVMLFIDGTLLDAPCSGANKMGKVLRCQVSCRRRCIGFRHAAPVHDVRQRRCSSSYWVL